MPPDRVVAAPEELTLGVHVELPVAVRPSPGATRDYDSAQLLRALYRPAVEAEGRYGLASPRDDGDSVLLTLRDDATWHDGSPVAPHELRDAIAAGFSRAVMIAELLGIAADAITVEGCAVRIRARAPALAIAVLADPLFAPRERGTTGPFILDDDGRYRPVRGGGPVLHPVLIGSPAEAVAAFDAGVIAATCPAMFDVRAHLGTRPAHRAITNMMAMVRINPRVDRRLAAVVQQACIDSRASLPATARDALAPVALPERALPGEAPPAATLQVLYGTYWPNQLIADAIVRELACRGIDAVAAGVDFGELSERHRHLRYDVLLSIEVGMWGRHSQLLQLVAALHRRLDGAARRICDELVADLARGDERAAEELWRMALDLVPIVPLFRFRSAFLASKRFGDSLAHDNFLRVEQLAPRWQPRDVLA